MLTWACLFIASAGPAAVPEVTLGPDVANQATLLEAPIVSVTVFSDRAKVRRRTTVEASARPRVLRWPDLSEQVLLDSIRARTEGAQVIRLQASPVLREGVSLEEADALLDKIEVLQDEIQKMDAEGQILDGIARFYSEISPAPPVAEDKRLGKTTGALAPEAWRRSLDAVGLERARARERKRALDKAKRPKLEELEKLRREALRMGAEVDGTTKTQVILALGAGGRATVELDYEVQGAVWRPSYVLRFLADDGRVVLETHGSVAQTTGEDWAGVEMALSTAMPGESIELPKLLTWTLGESRELIPRARPTRPPIALQIHPPPEPRESRRELEQAARAEIVLERLASLGSAPASMEPRPAPRAQRPDRHRDKKKAEIAFEDDTIEGELVEPEAEYLESRVAASDAPMAAPPPMAPSVASSGAKARSQKSAPRARSLALFEPAMRPRRIDLHDSTLPALLAGGLDYTYPARGRTSVPSTGEQHRIPLTSESYPVNAFYEATPSISTTAYLKATVTNKSDRPILQGPATIFLGSTFAGDAMMKTTGQGGLIELPLGADEDVRIARRIVPSTSSDSGVFSSSDLTEYRVTIEAANYKKRPITLTLHEPLPRSTHEDVEIELLEVKPKNDSRTEGILHWFLKLEPGKTRSIELRYRIKRPSGWQLQQVR